MQGFIRKLFKHNKDTETQVEDYKFIWGVKSRDDLTQSEPNLYTMNDLDICFDEKKKLYTLGLETIYQFESRTAKERYLSTLVQEFYTYLRENNLFDVAYDPFNLYVYNNGHLFEAESLTELYYKFKLFVQGFKSM